MKKFLGILCILSFLFVIAACDGKKADQKKVDEVYDWLELPNLTEELTNDSPRIIMPTEREGYTDVTITWEIDKPEYISYDGVITQPPHEEGDQTVTITATIKLNDIEKKKTFTGKVLALPPVTETPALLDETFKDYDDGELEPQTDCWSVVSGKAGTSKFTVVSSIEDVEIPEGSKALKVEAFTERTLEASIKHDYDIVVVEADLMQTASSDGTSIHLQSYYSSPQVAFGLNGKTLYYRVDNGEQLGITVELNKWYRARFEVDLKNKTIELFYYENGQLVAITPGKVPYSGTTSFQSFYIRTGSSTTTELKPPAYITNIRINRPEAMPRPEEEVKLGEITGIEDVNLVLGTEFQPAEPMVKNYYGTKRELVKNEDYILEIIHEIDVNVPGVYEVVYKFTNKNDQNDVKQVKQFVTVYAEGDPNEIKSVESTQAIYPDWLTDVTVKLVQPAGTLYYYLSGNETETLETVLEGEQIEVDSENVVIENLAIGDSTYIHIVISHNGYTDVFSHQLNRMNVLEISTPQEFHNAVFNVNSQENYFLLTADLDFSEFEWQGLGPRFYGILDGNGYAISNLTINVPDSTKVGIFTELDGATIKNLVFDNVEIYSMKERAGILAGITTNHATNIENITVYGSKVVVGDSTTEDANHYAGLLLGRSEVSTVISNVYVRDSEVIVFGKYVGGLVGQVEKADLTIEDADVEIKVTEGLTSEVAGGIVGRNKGQLTLRRIIANVEVNGNRYLGGFVGMNDASNSSTKIFDSLITGSLVGGAADKGAGVICGYLKNGTVENENVWAVNFTGENEISHRITVDEDFIIESLDTVSVSVWWTENIPSIAESELWDTAGFATLIREEVVRYTITFVVEDYEIDPIQVRANQTAVLPEPAKEGYKFIGWFLDENYETPFDPETVITGDLTLFGKFEEITLPSYTVTFDTDGGSTIDSVTVYEGETVAKPNDPVKEGFEFAGWYKDFEYTEEFDFDTPVTGNITLYAKWDPLIKVTFVANGGQVFLGDEEVNYIYLKPDSLLPELTVQKEGHNFGGWFVDEDLTEAFVLEAPITQDITLYAKWDEKAGITIETVEDFLAFLDNPQDETYVLNADLDFNGATVETSNKVFVGILDGQGHVISNLKLVAQDNYGGLFAGLNGATVKNLVFHNVEVVALARAGLLAGESNNEKVTVKNITAIDCRVFSGNDDTLGNDIYAALIIGRARVETEIQNIKVVSSEVLVKGKYVGGLLGYAEKKVDMSDIDAEIKVTEISTSSTAQLVGGIVGRVGSSGVLTLNRVIAKVDLTGWKNIGGLLGKNDGTAYVYDAVITGELKLLEGSSSKDLGAISGNKSFNETVNVWAVAVIGEGTGGNKQSAPEDKTLGSLEDVADSAWWQENMPNIAESELWDVTGGFAELVKDTPFVTSPSQAATEAASSNISAEPLETLSLKT